MLPSNRQFIGCLICLCLIGTGCNQALKVVHYADKKRVDDTLKFRQVEQQIKPFMSQQDVYKIIGDPNRVCTGEEMTKLSYAGVDIGWRPDAYNKTKYCWFAIPQGATNSWLVVELECRENDVYYVDGKTIWIGGGGSGVAAGKYYTVYSCNYFWSLLEFGLLKRW
ncbi:MAG: hypothetical protein JW709_02185 [Sedimentisphaerales bacterium]|nr:hypothetical protein [Sedimentisphaerales bacterium]